MMLAGDSLKRVMRWDFVPRYRQYSPPPQNPNRFFTFPPTPPHKSLSIRNRSLQTLDSNYFNQSFMEVCVTRLSFPGHLSSSTNRKDSIFSLNFGNSPFGFRVSDLLDFGLSFCRSKGIEVLRPVNVSAGRLLKDTCLLNLWFLDFWEFRWSVSNWSDEVGFIG